MQEVYTGNHNQSAQSRNYAYNNLGGLDWRPEFASSVYQGWIPEASLIQSDGRRFHQAVLHDGVRKTAGIGDAYCEQ